MSCTPGFSADGTLIAAGDRPTARVWSLDTKQCLYKIKIEFSPKIMALGSKRLAVSDSDGAYKFAVIDLETRMGRCKTTSVPICNDGIKTSHDGDFLILFDYGDTMRTLDLSEVTSSDDLDHHKASAGWIKLIVDDNTVLSAII